MDRDVRHWIAELSALRASGRLTDEEFHAARIQLMNPAGPAANAPWVPYPRSAPTTLVPLPSPPPGPPAPPPRPRRTRLAIVALAVVVLMAGLGAVVLAGRSVPPPPPTPVPAPPAPTAAPAPPAPPPAPGARGRLDEQVRADAPAVEGLADRWVAQLYAERIGAVRGGRTADADSVLRDYGAVKAQYPQALLLVSGTFESFVFPDYHVVVLSTPFAGPEEVLAWCAGQGRPADYCFAKRLSHTAGPDGSTVYRR